MRWLILTDDHPPALGGVATFAAATARALEASGCDVRVYARARQGLEGARGVSGRSFGRRSGTWLGISALPYLRSVDAVLATTWVAGTLAARLAPSRLHVVAHGSDVTRPPVRPRAFRRTWSRAAGRWAVSRFLAEQLRGEGVEARLLPLPVDAVDRPRRSSGLRRAVLVARATPLKGGLRFVRLVATLGIEGLVVGDGPQLACWRDEAARLDANIQFVGSASPAGVRSALGRSDLAVLLPRARPDGTGAEGLGLVLLEAAALGVPAVGCATGGVPEAVGPGLVLPQPDDAAESAARILDWWSEDRGEAAWAWLRENHGSARTVAALSSLR